MRGHRGSYMVASRFPSWAAICAMTKFALNYGAGTRTRTEDLLITNQLLYQLSYAGPAWTTFKS